MRVRASDRLYICKRVFERLGVSLICRSGLVYAGACAAPPPDLRIIMISPAFVGKEIWNCGDGSVCW